MGQKYGKEIKKSERFVIRGQTNGFKKE